MKVLITGGNGYIATNIEPYLSRLYNVDSITRRDLDLLDSKKVNSFFVDKFYDVVIHTAIKGGSRLKEDSPSIVYDNILMLDNIISNKQHYKRFINLGSGAEVFYPKTPYGVSKRAILNTINHLDEHFTLRIFAIFNEKELDTRYIKSNILRYINKQNLEIYQNRYMDFFSINDFIKVLKMYVEVESKYLDKEFDCCYNKKNTLIDIAKIINNLDTHKVDLNIGNDTLGDNYIGNYFCKYDLRYRGLEKSIEDVYNILKKV